MNPDVLKPQEENLFSLAAEMGLVVMSGMPITEKMPAETDDPFIAQSKPFSQLT